MGDSETVPWAALSLAPGEGITVIVQAIVYVSRACT
jgi:hypothetical protein